MRKGCKACESGKKHPALVYMYYEDGKLRCRHVRPAFAPALKQAIENGRALDRLLAPLGWELLKDLRAEQE
jgi:hypothetical protein